MKKHNLKEIGYSDLEVDAAVAAQDYSKRMYATVDASVLQLECCEDDFQAGYLSGAGKYNADLQFAISQLKQILDMSRSQREPYATSIARYTLQKLGVTK